MKTEYQQSVTFVKDRGTMGIYTVKNLVGLVEPEIGSQTNKDKIEKFIQANPGVKVTIKDATS